MTPSNEYYEMIERRLTNLLSSVRPRLGREDRIAAEEYVYYAEYGLALGQICDGVVYGDGPISGEAAREIMTLADIMEMGDEVPPELSEHVRDRRQP